MLSELEIRAAAIFRALDMKYSTHQMRVLVDHLRSLEADAWAEGARQQVGEA